MHHVFCRALIRHWVGCGGYTFTLKKPLFCDKDMAVQRLQMDGHCIKLHLHLFFVVPLWSWPKGVTINFKVPWGPFIYKSRFFSFPWGKQKEYLASGPHSYLETVVRAKWPLLFCLSWPLWTSFSHTLLRSGFFTCFLTCKVPMGLCVCDLCTKKY